MRAAARDPDGAPLASRLSMDAATITSRPALGAVQALLSAAHLPVVDLTEAHCELFFYAGTAQDPVGIIGLEHAGDAALLRSLVVRADHRGTGLGGALVAYAERQARARGTRAIYLLTTTAEPFFAARGYARAARDTAPAAIRATREFGGLCPASSAFMTKLL
jgi:amino-acid N-acetyltransferase